MKNAKNIVWLGAACAALVLVTGIFVAAPVVAQTARAALVRDIDNPALQPFRIVQFCGNTTGTSVTCQPAMVPTGKRLVIEYVGFVADARNEDPVTDLWLKASGPGSSALWIAVKPEDRVVKPGGTHYQAVFNQLVKLYFEPGETIEVNALYVNNSSSVKNFRITLQGYFVNLN